MLEVTVSPKAISDSFEIWSYIAHNSFQAADRWIDELNDQYNLISRQPFIGRQQDNLEADLRSIPFGRYLIFYKIQQETIFIVRVLHSARNISLLFI